MMWWGRYIGLPYEQAHCWELVRRVYAERLGVQLPAYGEVDARDLVRVAREIDRGQDRWQPVDLPAEYDGVLMRGRRGIWHVGVMTDARHVLHTERATSAVRVPLDHLSIKGRIAGFRRYVV
ncbi:hypothetical protein [Roseinatronobacter sp.]|uniref:hypothetical protein n=1 Tax=Roseinatronobacter sp. TaxID=1945755 RepID=UPI003F730196